MAAYSRLLLALFLPFSQKQKARAFVCAWGFSSTINHLPPTATVIADSKQMPAESFAMSTFRRRNSLLEFFPKCFSVLCVAPFGGKGGLSYTSAVRNQADESTNARLNEVWGASL